jgi:hypothetical protein
LLSARGTRTEVTDRNPSLLVINCLVNSCVSLSLSL